MSRDCRDTIRCTERKYYPGADHRDRPPGDNGLMAPTAAHTSPTSEGAHLLLYDGVCGLCDSLIQLVLKHDRHHVFHFASLQSDAAKAALAPFNCDPNDLTTMYVVRDYRSATPVPLARGRAALFVASMLDWPWKAATALRLLPTVLINLGYNLIARYRYRLFGRYDQCLMPSPEYRDRFIDESFGSRPRTLAPSRPRT